MFWQRRWKESSSSVTVCFLYREVILTFPSPRGFFISLPSLHPATCPRRLAPHSCSLLLGRPPCSTTQTCWGDQRSCGIWCLQELCLLPRCRRRRKSELPPPCNRPWWRKLWYCVWSRWNFCWRIRFGWERKWVICRWGEEQKWELVAATMEIGGENRQLG